MENFNHTRVMRFNSILPILEQRMSGFTLMEMIIVIAISAILMAVGVPSFITSVERNNIAAQVNDLTSALQYARNQAISQGTYVAVCRTTSDTAASPMCDSSTNDWGAGYIVFVDDNPAGTRASRDTSELVLKRIPSVTSTYKNLRAGGGGSTAEVILFNPQGQYVGSNTRFMIFTGTTVSPNTGTAKTVCLNLGGRIRAVDGLSSTTCS